MEEIATTVEELEAEVAAFNPADDPLLPEEPAAVSQPRRAALSLRELAGDDRDIIVVQEPEPVAASSTPPAVPPKRREYRQLFSTLRKR
jgi:hypothetical protein